MVPSIFSPSLVAAFLSWTEPLSQSPSQRQSPASQLPDTNSIEFFLDACIGFPLIKSLVAMLSQIDTGTSTPGNLPAKAIVTFSAFPGSGPALTSENSLVNSRP